MTTTFTSSSTYTIINARYVSSKIAADLDLCRQYFDRPTENSIQEYKEELAELLNGGYVKEYEFGFKRDDKRIVCWRYTVKDDGTISTDDRPGRLDSLINTSGALFYNFLTFSLKWENLQPEERARVEKHLPFRRTGGTLPSDGNGYWTSDRIYSSGSIGVTRKTFKPLT